MQLLYHNLRNVFPEQPRSVEGTLNVSTPLLPWTLSFFRSFFFSPLSGAYSTRSPLTVRILENAEFYFMIHNP